MTDNTVVASPAPASPPGRRPMSAGDRIRFALRGIGQTLITLGLVVLLFVVYEVWITNIFAHQAQVKVYNALQHEWQDGQDPLLPLPGENTTTIPLGSGIAVLYIPRLGRDYHFAVVQGSQVPDDAQLEKGPAHYADTQLPGETGNFAVAGHRVGKGEPFLNIDKLQSGDAVIVETKSFWYVYRVIGKPAGQNPQTVKEQVATVNGNPIMLPGREIVDPSDGDVLQPVPDNPGATPQKALMTFTTCHPKFTASQRMIVYSELVSKAPNNKKLKMPDSIEALYSEVNA
ncbi:MAG TPA: class E sortase [Jatrophihabitans sp.]|nr:class E sortase [Jatrophihabitans sp.]